ncbi:MAG: GntR family transcriptional regulator [Firmicutes bacterium]|nr:GntR family transcriptional regulator [Bacillota bacterium]
MKEFKSMSLADQVFAQLERDIIMGVYQRGDILTELGLVEQLGVSRTPIREALRRLEQERLIEDTGKGSRVLGISEDDLLDIMTIRQHIEPLASYYAALNLDAAGLEELQNIVDLQEFYYQKNNTERLREMDNQFHKVICRLCGRAVITDTLQMMHRKTQRYRKSSIEDPNRIGGMVAEHRAIFDAIAAKDADKAAELTARHVNNAKENMIARFKNNG